MAMWPAIVHPTVTCLVRVNANTRSHSSGPWKALDGCLSFTVIQEAYSPNRSLIVCRQFRNPPVCCDLAELGHVERPFIEVQVLRSKQGHCKYHSPILDDRLTELVVCRFSTFFDKSDVENDQLRLALCHPVKQLGM